MKFIKDKSVNFFRETILILNYWSKNMFTINFNINSLGDISC